MNWIRRLFGMCAHKWETVSKHNLTYETGSTGLRYILRCRHCGDVCKRDLI